MIILAAAMGLNNELGKSDGIPLWDLPDEYAAFRNHIKSHPIIMGRKSFDVIKDPLPGSMNIVITHRKDYEGNGGVVVHSLEEAIERAKPDKKIYVTGGGEIFGRAIKIAHKMEISRIDGTFPEAEVFFPRFSKSEWELTASEFHEKDERHVYSFTFQTWVRR